MPRHLPPTLPKSLYERLTTMKELHPMDAQLVERVTKVRALRLEGLSYAKIHAQLGEWLEYKNVGSVRDLVVSADYGTVCQWLDEGQKHVADARAEQFVHDGRLELCELTPAVVLYLKECLLRFPDGTFRKEGLVMVDVSGQTIDDSKAQWAVQLIAKTTGLSEAPPQYKPNVVIPIGEVHFELTVLRQEDEASSRIARAITVEATPALDGPHTSPSGTQ